MRDVLVVLIGRDASRGARKAGGRAGDQDPRREQSRREAQRGEGNPGPARLGSSESKMRPAVELQELLRRWGKRNLKHSRVVR